MIQKCTQSEELSSEIVIDKTSTKKYQLKRLPPNPDKRAIQSKWLSSRHGYRQNHKTCVTPSPQKGLSPLTYSNVYKCMPLYRFEVVSGRVRFPINLVYGENSRDITCFTGGLYCVSYWYLLLYAYVHSDISGIFQC